LKLRENIARNIEESQNQLEPPKEAFDTSEHACTVIYGTSNRVMIDDWQEQERK
jgi:hypothetical protein